VRGDGGKEKRGGLSIFASSSAINLDLGNFIQGLINHKDVIPPRRKEKLSKGRLHTKERLGL